MIRRVHGALHPAARWIILLHLVLIMQRAGADPLDTFGYTARASALAGALTADASGHVAAFYNPAGVARSADAEVAAGWGAGLTHLAIDGTPARVTTPRGTTVGLSIPIPLGPVRLAFGLAAYLPDQFIARIRLTPPAEPRFFLLDNDVDRIVVQPVLALRIARWLSIGAGASLLADAAGNGVDFDVGLTGGKKVGRAALDVTLPLRAAPLVGVTVEPLPRLRVGASYRGALDLSLRLDILAHVDIAGAVTGDTAIVLRAINLYTPQRLALGVAVDAAPGLTINAECAWVNWGAFHGGVPDLRIRVALGVAPALLDPVIPEDRFRDVFVPRLGAEYRAHVGSRVGLAGRLGLAFERSPVPDQTGLTSFADNDRVVIGAGAGLELTGLGPTLPKPVRLDVGMSWHELVPRETAKDPKLLPGSGFTSGGRIVHLSATLEARF